MTGLKRSTFFYHLPPKIDKNAVMRQKVIEIYQDNDGNYGYRRITLKLSDFFGAINHKRIQVKLKGLSPVQYRTQSLN
ncbi:putative transposase-like protein [Actinobacillus ureae]|nr:putative transposase-like protein [Actinobacillus ureae]